MDNNLKGVSRFVKKAVAVLPTAPKMEINATPMPPQHAPAPAPRIEPSKPDLNFFVLACKNLIRYMDMLSTRPVSIEMTTIDRKFGN